MAEEKPKQIFGENEHGKFENKTCTMAEDVDIEELRRENQLLKEKLTAIQNVQNDAGKPPRATSSRPKSRSVSSEDLSCAGKEKTSERANRSNSCSRYKPEKYWNWYNSPTTLPCQYNPRCYSKSHYNGICDCIEDEYLADMLYRYPDYFGRGRGRSAGHFGMRAKSYEDVNRILELNALYDNNVPRRWRPRTRSVEGRVTPPVPPAVAAARIRGLAVEDPHVWDPYFANWRTSGYSGGPRIPFRPRSVWDVTIGMKVSMHRSDGRLSRGTIRWIGLLPNLVGEYVGVELETQTGRHDGYLNGVRYFKCKENCGIFVKFSKIIMAWR